MTFETAGQIGKPKVLLIHPMLNDASCFGKFRAYLEDDYFLIIPTLDGHDGKSEFISLQEEVSKIGNYLIENDFTDLDFILGTSLGAIVAFAVFQDKRLHVRRLYLDGIPFFKFGPVVRKIAGGVYLQVWKYCRKNPDKAVDKFRKFFDEAAERMVTITCRMSKKSVRNLSDACYHNEVIPVEAGEQRKITYLFGSKEPALLCRRRIEKYEGAKMIIFKGYGHCAYLNKNTKAYLDIITGKAANI